MKENTKFHIYNIAGLVILGILELYHLIDVRDGMTISGLNWLVTFYMILECFVLIVLCVVGVSLYNNKFTPKKLFNLEHIYAFTAFTLGLAFMFVLPPLSAPDEVSHYISAYRVSDIMMGKTDTDTDGMTIIRPEDTFLEDYTGVESYTVEDGQVASDPTVYPSAINDNVNDGAVLGQDISVDTYRAIHDYGMLKGSRAVIDSDYAKTAYPYVMTTPLAYVPQAIGITIARLLRVGPIGLAYMGRFFNLIFFILITFLAMKRTPIGKSVVFGVCVLPMTLHLAASFSYDVWPLAWVIYLTCVVLNLIYKKERVTIPDVIELIFIAALAMPCKMIYTPMLLICLLIPAQKFGGMIKKVISGACVVFACVVSMIVVNVSIIQGYASATDNTVVWAGEQGYTLNYLLHNPIVASRLPWDTILAKLGLWMSQMLGGQLCNMNETLGAPFIVLIIMAVGLILLALKKPGEAVVIKKKNRWWFAICIILCVGMAMLSMCIAWTPISVRIIQGVQGRYFLPMLPLALLLIRNDKVVMTGDYDRQILYTMICADAYLLIRLYSSICLMA